MLKKDFEVIVIFLYGLSSTLRLTKRKEKKRKERQERNQYTRRIKTILCVGVFGILNHFDTVSV